MGRPEPDITVVIPVLDEATTIGDCIEAIAAQTIPRESIEVLVVDGGSRDATPEVAQRHLKDAGFNLAALLSSESGSRPANLNAGLAEARGRILCRVDARSRIPPHYLGRCRDVLDAHPEISVVGGRHRAQSESGGALRTGIARAYNNRWATGLGRYRRSNQSGPSDTVYLGAFRVEQLRAIGGWREEMVVNEDFDLNRRMAKLGVVWFDRELIVDYLPRPETLPALFEQHVEFGRSKVRYWHVTGDPPRLRQMALIVAPLAAAAAAAGVVVAAPKRTPALVGSLAAAAIAVEVMGADTPHGSISGHAAGLAAMACMCAGWLGGIWSGIVAAALSRRP